MRKSGTLAAASIAVMTVVFVNMVVIGLFGGKQKVPVTHFENVIADIDNDGDDDLIIYADVVVNGSTDFPLIKEESSDKVGDMSDNVCVDKEITAVLTIFREIEEPLMSSGESYAAWYNKAARCPDWMPYGTRLTLPGGEEFACMHRSGVLYYKALEDDIEHISLLIDSLPVPLDTKVSIKVDCGE